METTFVFIAAVVVLARLSWWLSGPVHTWHNSRQSRRARR